MYDTPLRAYSKSELAMLYFPKASTPHSAVNMLMLWINRCQPLMESLSRYGYRKNDKMLSRRHVQLIFEFIGEP